MTKDDRLLAPLNVRLIHAALRYEQMTAAVLQSFNFIRTSVVAAMDVDALGKEIVKFEDYLKPQSLTFLEFFAGMLLSNLIAEVENYLVEVMKHLLLEFPRKLSATQFTLADVLDNAPQELVLRAAESRLAKLMYKRPAEYIKELAEILSIDAAPFAQYWSTYVEAKARRDLGVHNAWQINETYRRKVTEAGRTVGSDAGPTMVPDFEYLSAVLGGCDKIVRNIQAQLDAKFSSGVAPA